MWKVKLSLSYLRHPYSSSSYIHDLPSFSFGAFCFGLLFAQEQCVARLGADGEHKYLMTWIAWITLENSQKEEMRVGEADMTTSDLSRLEPDSFLFPHVLVAWCWAQEAACLSRNLRLSKTRCLANSSSAFCFLLLRPAAPALTSAKLLSSRLPQSGSFRSSLRAAFKWAPFASMGPSRLTEPPPITWMTWGTLNTKCTFTM